MKDLMFTLRQTYNLPARQAQLMNLLLNNRYVTYDMIETKFKIYTDAKVAIHKLRRLLAPFEITVGVMRGAGYFIDEPEKKKIWATLTEKDAA
jgi:hypothetical protein